jgi:hypothetical protein
MDPVGVFLDQIGLSGLRSLCPDSDQIADIAGGLFGAIFGLSIFVLSANL